MERFTFGSKYPGFLLVLEPGGPKYIQETGQWIPKVPFRGITFYEGVYDTTNAKEADELRKHPRFGKDFWEIQTPEDAQKVNMGRRIETVGSAKGTAHQPTRK